MATQKVDKRSMMVANQKTVMGLLEQMKGEIARCLPKHLTPERMARIAMTELRKTPKLQECDPLSFIASIMQAAQLGLEPGILGSCYLIPFWNSKLGKFECTFMPGYRGFLDLARRSGQIVSLVARSVYENDEFSYEFGLKENIIHKPAMDNKGQLIAVYAVAILKDGGHQFDVMSKEEVDTVRETSKSKDNGPWVTHYEEMAKKTVLRRLFKWLPCSVEMQKAVSLDEMQEAGMQNIKVAASEEFDIDFVIDADTGEVTEVPGNKSREDLKALIEKNKAESKNSQEKETNMDKA
ncbi:recombination protein RecT [Legionella pneumophila serogroup 1]|uniref:recombination protein RecT n=1 Tax=Legionella pneumophila TaxID=446 RepID=UPI0009B3D5E1|nr:recombination protein RecT [Legionella pneumophila]HCC3235814.1 recombination protein RecT [Legionella pneumophila subsp. pneumophila]MCW8457394.1 recombination protein RecT [Legionella pneumophila]HAT2149796.1 recombination protein RecT [Legionella pneumophila]HAT8621044.1 recombination protein RecT [Legionella pneumophila]HAT8730874.1 recombination protein RecT [Legionella pneumophila]